MVVATVAKAVTPAASRARRMRMLSRAAVGRFHTQKAIARPIGMTRVSVGSNGDPNDPPLASKSPAIIRSWSCSKVL